MTGGRPVRRRRGPLRGLLDLGDGDMTLAANVAAGLTWLALGTVVLMFVLDDAVEVGDLASIGAGLGLVGLMPIAVASVMAACVATGSAVPLAIAWYRGRERPLAPGLSFAHLLVAWGTAGSLLVSRVLSA